MTGSAVSLFERRVNSQFSVAHERMFEEPPTIESVKSSALAKAGVSQGEIAPAAGLRAARRGRSAAGQPRTEQRCWLWALVGTAALTFISVALSLANRFWNVDVIPALHLEWMVWLPVVHGVGLVFLLWRCGRPATPRGWVLLVVLNVWLGMLEALHRQGIFDLAVVLAADLLLRAVVLGLWGMVCLGLPYVLFWIWRHRSSPRPPFVFGRFWFSVLVLLFTAEPIMALLDRHQDAIAFPERLRDPPSGELRIVSIGDSTMHGHPYDLRFGIPQVIAWRLQQMYPEREIVSQNLALRGLSLQQAINCLQELEYRPHLLLMYSGHNEFLHDVEELASHESAFGKLDDVLNLSPTFRQLNLRLRQDRFQHSLKSGVMLAFVRFPVAVPEVLERKERQFRRQLEQLAHFGRSQGIPMLWYVPAASESGYEPNRSIVAYGTAEIEIAALEQSSERGQAFERCSDWPAAAQVYRDALEYHPQFAEFHFRLGECLMHTGDHAQARSHFQKALDADGYPVRAPAAYRTLITEVAAASSVPVVFTAEALRPHTEHGILDRSLFHDNVHPTLRGFFLMGAAGEAQLVASGLLERSFGHPAAIPPARFADAIAAMQIDRTDVANGLRGIANGLRWLALLRFDSSRREEQADRYVRLAKRLDAGEINPGDAGTESLR